MTVMTQSRCYTGVTKFKKNFIKYYDKKKFEYPNWVFLCEICLADIKTRFEETYQYGGITFFGKVGGVRRNHSTVTDLAKFLG